MAIVKLGDKYGYINKKGQIVIPIIYDDATSFYNGIAKVNIKDNDVSKSKIINTKGEILVEELNISSFSKDFKYVYLHNSDQQYFRYNIKENIIEDLNEYFTSLNHYLNFSKGVFKDVDVYLSQDFKALMSEDIDFSKYESRELVKKGNDLYLYQSKFNEAIKMFEEAIEFDKNNKNAFLGMANVYEQKDNYNEAIKYFNKAIELDPDYIDAISQKAEYNFKNNYWNEALIDYRKLLNKNSNDYSVCFNKAICEQRLNLIDDAINTYTLYINNYTKSSAAYNNRGNALLQKGIYSRAIEDYTAAIKVGTSETKENLGIFYTNRGRAYSRLNKKNEACLDYKKGADLDNKDAISYYRYCK
jgi:tetratricopeptide (TPR) repeat protein